MTRPPFAEFSGIAIRELMTWVGKNALWSGRLAEVLNTHVLPAAQKLGLDPEQAWEELREHHGPVFGAALEALCALRYDQPPENLVADFLRKRGLHLPPLARTYLEVLREARLGFYEVVAVAPGTGMTLRDLLVAGEPFDVVEVSGSRQVVVWDRLAARVLEHGGKRMFSGVIVPLGAGAEAEIDPIKALLHAAVPEAGASPDAYRQAVADVMRDATPRIAAFRIETLLGGRKLPALSNRDGDPIEPATALYVVVPGRRKDVIARLDAHAALQRTSVRPVRWKWSGPAPERDSSRAEGLVVDTHPGSDTGRVVLADLLLSRERFELDVNSRRRLQRARDLIEPLLAGLIDEPRISVESVEDMLAEGDSEPAPRPRMPKAKARALERRFLDEYYRKWLDEAIPALGGKSPREAARDPGGRAQLAALLKEMENRETRRARDTGEGYDARWLWRELGIEHLRR